MENELGREQFTPTNGARMPSPSRRDSKSGSSTSSMERASELSATIKGDMFELFRLGQELLDRRLRKTEDTVETKVRETLTRATLSLWFVSVAAILTAFSLRDFLVAIAQSSDAQSIVSQRIISGVGSLFLATVCLVLPVVLAKAIAKKRS